MQFSICSLTGTVQNIYQGVDLRWWIPSRHPGSLGMLIMCIWLFGGTKPSETSATWWLAGVRQPLGFAVLIQVNLSFTSLSRSLPFPLLKNVLCCSLGISKFKFVTYSLIHSFATPVCKHETVQVYCHIMYTVRH